MDMKVSFNEKVITTTIYIKLVAPDQLLLSEKICHSLGIVNYYPSVRSVPRCQPIIDVSCNAQHRDLHPVY